MIRINYRLHTTGGIIPSFKLKFLVFLFSQHKKSNTKSVVKFLAKTKGTQVGQNYEVSESYMDSALPSQVTRSSKI